METSRIEDEIERRRRLPREEIRFDERDVDALGARESGSELERFRDEIDRGDVEALLREMDR